MVPDQIVKGQIDEEEDNESKGTKCENELDDVDE